MPVVGLETWPPKRARNLLPSVPRTLLPAIVRAECVGQGTNWGVMPINRLSRP
jgi:hypothetical protein